MVFALVSLRDLPLNIPSWPVIEVIFAICSPDLLVTLRPLRPYLIGEAPDLFLMSCALNPVLATFELGPARF